MSSMGVLALSLSKSESSLSLLVSYSELVLVYFLGMLGCILLVFLLSIIKSMVAFLLQYR